MIKIYAKHVVFRDVAQALYQVLRKQKCAVTISTSFPIPGDDIYIIFGAHDLPKLLQRGTKYIVYQLEQTPRQNADKSSVWNQEYLRILHEADAVWDYSVENVRFLRTRCRLSDVYYVPLGYASSLEMEVVKTPNKDIDILFFGSESDRRKKYINALQDHFEDKYNIVWKKNSLWDTERVEYIQRSKIVLNIHHGKNGLLEIPRLLSIVSNKGFIISEKGCHVNTTDKWSDKVHFISSSPNDLIQMCTKFLEAQPYERKKWTTEAYKRVKLMEFIFPPGFCSLHQTDKKQRRRRKKIEWYYPTDIESTKLVKEDDGGVRMVLDYIDDDKLPCVSIITPTRNRRHLFSLTLRNWMMIKYPKDKLEWVIVDDGTEDLSDLVKSDSRIRYTKLDGGPNGFPIGQKRNICCEIASHDVIVCMDDDDYYFPENVLSRVKTLITNNVGCVGCSAMGAYDLTTDKSAFISNGPRFLTESTMAFTKSFWKSRQFYNYDGSGEYDKFLRFRQTDVRTIPYQFVSVAFFHGGNMSGLRRKIAENEGSYHTIHDVVDEDTLHFIQSLRRSIQKTNQTSATDSMSSNTI